MKCFNDIVAQLALSLQCVTTSPAIKSLIKLKAFPAVSWNGLEWNGIKTRAVIKSIICTQLFQLFLKDNTLDNRSDVLLLKAFLTHYLGTRHRSSHWLTFLQARHAEEIGADSIALITPSFYKPATAGIHSFYRK